MKRPVREVNAYHLARCPRHTTASHPAHPLNSRVYSADEIVSVHCCYIRIHLYPVFVKLRFQVFILVYCSSCVEEDNPAVVAPLLGDLINAFNPRDRKDGGGERILKQWH